jgi:hypothetical protein
MSRTEELIQLREQIKVLEYKAANEPAIIRQKGTDVQIQLLKKQERALLETMSYEEIHAAEIGATEQLRQVEEENTLKNKKTLVVAGSIAGFILVASIITVIIIKRRKK